TAAPPPRRCTERIEPRLQGLRLDDKSGRDAEATVRPCFAGGAMPCPASRHIHVIRARARAARGGGVSSCSRTAREGGGRRDVQPVDLNGRRRAMDRRWKASLLALVLGLWPGEGEALAAVLQQTGVVQGTVTDARTGAPLTGVQVSVAGTGEGELTNAQGRYTIQNVPAGQVTISAQSLGYGTME